MGLIWSDICCQGDTIIEQCQLVTQMGFIRKFQGFKVKVGTAAQLLAVFVWTSSSWLKCQKKCRLIQVVIISNNPDDPNNIKAAADYVDTTIMRLLAY